MIINFKKEKETKNTIRYEEVTENEHDLPVLRNIYVRKDIAKGATKLKITLELEEMNN